MHDLVVGLLCFDVVYVPLSCAARIHDLLGSNLFWRFVKEDVVKFIEWKQSVGIIFPTPDAATGGDIGNFIVFDKEGHEKPLGEFVRSQLKPVPGKEAEAESLFELLVQKTVVITEMDEPNIPALTRGALLRQTLRDLIGLSGAILPTYLPRWMQFPILRLANVIKLGATCSLLGIPSVKLEFGSDGIAAPAFSAAARADIADEVASYVLSARFDLELGGLILRDPALLEAIVAFRQTADGISIRKAILENLAFSDGSDFPVAINAALRSSIPPRILQQANDRLSGLMMRSPSSGIAPSVPILWNDLSYADRCLLLWRQQCAKHLAEHCRQLRIGPYDPCPCGSDEKLKYCCQEALGH